MIERFRSGQVLASLGWLPGTTCHRFRVHSGWQFVTGKKSDIDLIRRNLGVYDPDAQKIAHMNVLTIGNEQTGQWLAMEALAKPDDIIETVLRLADSRIGRLRQFQKVRLMIAPP